MSILQLKHKHMVVSPSCLGPFPMTAVTDHVRGRLVAQQGHPVILQEGTRFAVLAPPNKDLRVICAGCFTPGMSLFEDSKCKRVSSFAQHWDTKRVDGRHERKECCKAVGYHSLENCILRVNAIKDEEIDTSPIDSIYNTICNHIDMLGAVLADSSEDASRGLEVTASLGERIRRLTPRIESHSDDGSFSTAVLEGTLNRLVGGQYDIPYTPVVDRVAKLLADKEGLEDKVGELERKLSDLESRSEKAATPRDALDLAMMARAAGIDVDVPTLMEVPTEDLIDELKRRNEVEKAASWIETDDIAVIARDRGIKLLIDGRFEDLEAEMRRVSDPSRPTVEGYYFTEKRDGAAHVTDAPLATMETFQDLISAEDMAIIKAKRARGIGPAPPLCHPYGTRPGTKRYKLRKLKDSRTQGF